MKTMKVLEVHDMHKSQSLYLVGTVTKTQALPLGSQTPSSRACQVTWMKEARQAGGACTLENKNP